MVTNKRAYFEYEFSEEYECGLKLLGTEVKSLRKNGCSINESFCVFINNELFVKQMHIAEYSEGGKYFNHDTVRLRKLLLNKKELSKLEKGLKIKGSSIIPLKLYLNEKGLFKLKIGLGRGKNNFQKKDKIKNKDIDRDTARTLKNI